MKFNGTEKQNKWASTILNAANLTEKQVDNVLRYAGPTMYDAGIMDVTIIIENRHNLAAYADSLGKFYTLSREAKYAVAEEAAECIHRIVRG